MRDKDRAFMTVTVTREQRKMLRYLAADLDKSISAIIRDWIENEQKPTLYNKKKKENRTK